MPDLRGFTYFCDMLSVITRSSEKRNRVLTAARTGNRLDNHGKDVLSADLASLFRGVKESEALEKQLLTFYCAFTDDAEQYYRDYSADAEEQYRNGGGRTFSNAVNNIVVNQKGVRPYFLFGLSLTLVLASGWYSDENFYIGQEETKELLFRALAVFGYSNAECIPDACFSDTDALRRLLMAALYQSLLVMFPWHENLRRGNLERGREVIERVLGGTESRLFSAFRTASEADAVIRLLWKKQDEHCRRGPGVGERELTLEEFYTVPGLLSESGQGFLSCDARYRVRAFVEGRSGAGKTGLAKAATLFLRDGITDGELSESLHRCAGIRQQEYIPILLSLGKLTASDLREYSLIECGLNQMYDRGAELCGDGAAHSVLSHYRECRGYILKYAERKAQSSRLLLLLDGYSELSAVLRREFLEKLELLFRAYPHLHAVIFSDRLRPSERRLFADYTKFRIPDSFDAECCFGRFRDRLDESLVLKFEQSRGDRAVRSYLDTPARLFEFLNGPGEENIYRIAAERMEEELTEKCGEEIPVRRVRAFFGRLAEEALFRRQRTEEPLIIPDNMLTARVLRDTGLSGEEADSLCGEVRSRGILLEQAESVNSYRFRSPLYFSCLLRERLLESMEEDSLSGCAGTVYSLLSRMNGEELSDIFYSVLSEAGSGSGPLQYAGEDKLKAFISISGGLMLSFERQEEIAASEWALGRLLGDREFREGFVFSGNYRKRTALLSLMERLERDLCAERRGEKHA